MTLRLLWLLASVCAVRAGVGNCSLVLDAASSANSVCTSDALRNCSAASIHLPENAHLNASYFVDLFDCVAERGVDDDEHDAVFLFGRNATLDTADGALFHLPFHAIIANLTFEDSQSTSMAATFSAAGGEALLSFVCVVAHALALRSC